jgi:RNA polymerase sigma factor (TIGR02999 family)
MAGAVLQITALLAEARGGDASATDRLVPLLYGEMRRLARALMARERRDLTLQPTALVHEAYLRLLGGAADWQNRAHFLGAAAQAMRRILVERARRRARVKRGAGRERVTLTDGAASVEARPEELLALDGALTDLRSKDAAMGRVVELRYFGGLTVEETAEALGASVRSVHRLWAAARAWLHHALEGGPVRVAEESAGGERRG